MILCVVTDGFPGKIDPTSYLSTKANKTPTTTKKDVGEKAASGWKPQRAHRQNTPSSSRPGPFILGQTQKIHPLV